MIQGFRRFRLAPYQPSILIGATGFAWQTPIQQAECRTPESRNEQSTAELDGKHVDLFTRAAIHIDVDLCKCGIYITKNTNLGKGVTTEFNVLAQVIGWGNFIEYEEGWRTQFCQIDALTLVGMWTRKESEELQQALIKRYQVPVSVEQLVSKYKCCRREHNENFWIDPTTHSEVPICRLTDQGLKNLLELAMAMGTNDFAIKQTTELIAEYNTRNGL